MTITSTIALAELAEKGADVDMLRQMVQFMAQRLMEIDVEGRCGAGYDEKSAERTNSRNGYRDRTWETRAGTVDLKRLPTGLCFRLLRHATDRTAEPEQITSPRELEALDIGASLAVTPQLSLEPLDSSTRRLRDVVEVVK